MIVVYRNRPIKNSTVCLTELQSYLDNLFDHWYSFCYLVNFFDWSKHPLKIFNIFQLCWYFRKRISHRVQKIRTFSHFTKKVRTHPVPELPNMSSLQLITLNQLIIDRSQKLGAGEFGVVYAVSFYIVIVGRRPNFQGKLLLDGLLGKKFPVAIKVINPSTNLIPNVEQVRDFLLF